MRFQHSNDRHRGSQITCMALGGLASKLDGVAAGQRRQSGVQRFGVGIAGGLERSGLALQASELSVHKLDAGQLGLGIAGQAVELVGFTVDGDGGHGVFFQEKTPPPCEGRGKELLSITPTLRLG
jgi:hypothetical protein